MPYKVTFISGLFRGEADRERSNRAIGILLEALTQLSEDYLRTEPSVPLLYESGVRYHVEPHGLEEWQDIPTTLCRGWGDCEDLATFAAAERRVRFGIPAKPHFTWRKIGPRTTLYHIQTLLPKDAAWYEVEKNPSLRSRWVTVPGAKTPVLWTWDPLGWIEDPSRVLGMGDGKDR